MILPSEPLKVANFKDVGLVTLEEGEKEILNNCWSMQGIEHFDCISI